MTNTPKRTQPLSYPADPLAAIRELQELDNRPAPEPKERRGPGEPGSATTPPVASATSSEVGSERSSDPEATPPERLAKPREASGKRKFREPGQPPAAEVEAEGKNPMELAILEMLRKPYAAETAKGPFTVTTVKIPGEVWERLGWAASLTGRAKQDIIAEALKQWFADLVKGR